MKQTNKELDRWDIAWACAMGNFLTAGLVMITFWIIKGILEMLTKW